jgi:ligand-binding sensor domain-containing protein
VAGILAVLIAVPALAGDAPVGYVHESWTIEDGLPVNGIKKLIQPSDGYLWMATFDGLVRFDGVRFTIYNIGNTDGLPSNRIIDLIEAHDGSLWMMTEQRHVVRHDHGVFKTYGPEDGLAIAKARAGSPVSLMHIRTPSIRVQRSAIICRGPRRSA